jgi:serine/threonine-protein kinase RsbW
LNKQFRTTFKNQIGNVALARQGIAGFAADCGFSAEAIDDIRLAAGEALSNAIEHGCAKPSHKVVVVCTYDAGKLTIEIQDTGRGFPAPSDCLDVAPDSRGRGFGIFLMRRLMDEVSFERNGSVVRLVRLRSERC